MRVTKNGSEIFEIYESPDSVKAAAAKGYVPVVEMSKDGVKWEDVLGTEDSITAAIGKGYKARSFAAKEPEQYSKTESAFRGGLGSATLGFDDELGGVIGGAVGSLANGRTFGDEYERVRDTMRQQKKDAEAQNPWSYLGGSLLGGAIIPAGAGGAAKTVVGAVGSGALTGGLTGAIQGVGDNEKPEDLLRDVSTGAALGTVTGGLAGGAANVAGRALSGAKEGFVSGKGLGRLGDAAKGAWSGGKNPLSSEFSAFKRGFSDTKTELPALREIAGTMNGLKETLKSAGAAEDFRKFIRQSKAMTLSRMVPEGEGGEEGMRAARSMLDNMSDDEYVINRLMDEGPNDVKEWVAKNAAGLQSGQISADEYKNILDLGPKARIDARDFAANQREIAKGISPDVVDASQKMKGAITGRVSQLGNEAGQSFTGDIGNLVDDIGQSLGDAQSMKTIPAGVKSRIEAGVGILGDGKAPSHWGLKPGNFDEVDQVEQFRRLQKFRETLDKGIDWEAIKTGKRPINEGEEILANLRGRVDEILKKTPGKTQLDRVYQLGEEIRDKVFKKTEFKGGVDEFKLKRLFGNTDEANRFRAALSDLKEWASDPQYSKEAREAAQKMVDKFEMLYKLSDNSRAINSFRFKQGPSSPAIERMQSTLNKNTLVQDAVLNPSSFVSSADQFIKEFSQPVAGKSWAAMEPSEKAAFLKLWGWAKKEGSSGVVTPESMKKNFEYLLKRSQK